MSFISKCLKTSYLLVALLVSSPNLYGDWTSVESVSDSGDYAFEPVVKIGPFGRALALWAQFDGSNYRILAARQHENLTWANPSFISVSYQDSFAPQFEFDSFGNVVALWFTFDGSNYIVQSATLDSGTSSWSTAVDVSPSGQNSYYPFLDVDPLGNAVAVWYGFDGNNYVIQSAAFSRANGWNSPLQVTSDGQDSFDPKVGLDSLGNAIATWYAFDGTNYVIQAGSLPFQGSFWTIYPNAISTSGNDAFEPTLGVDPSGDAIVAFYEFDGSNYRIRSSYQAYGDNWTYPPLDVSPSGEDGYSPNIDIDSSANSTVVWEHFDGSTYHTRAANLPASATSWSSYGQISSFGIDAYQPKIQVNSSSGNAVAVWYNFDGSFYNIETAALPFNGSWSSPTEISPDGEFSTEPSVAVGNTGQAVIVWSNTSDFVIEASNGSNLF